MPPRRPPPLLSKARIIEAINAKPVEDRRHPLEVFDAQIWFQSSSEGSYLPCPWQPGLLSSAGTELSRAKIGDSGQFDSHQYEAMYINKQIPVTSVQYFVPDTSSEATLTSALGRNQWSTGARYVHRIVGLFKYGVYVNR